MKRVFFGLLAALVALPATAQSLLIQGSGSFVVPGGAGREEKTITVYHHRPAAWTQQSPVLMVMPGAGRNGWSYRDAWIEASEQYGILILSPHYSEEYYPEFWSYNLANMITGVKLNADRTDIASFHVNRNPAQWIFGDSDRIFDLVKRQLGLRTDTYDMFGHSAGGQILHRLALFHPSSKVGRIVAANSGWYTVPTLDDKFPYGVDGLLTKGQLHTAFATKLVVFLGELDNRDETRGDLTRTPQTDLQGLSRIERGRYFYEVAAETAKSLNADFHWKLHIVPGVGHDFQRMSRAAVEYLY